MISNLTNPKMAAFFPALLPQFVPAGDAAFALLLGLGLLFALLTLVWLTAYSFAVARVGGLARPAAGSAERSTRPSASCSSRSGYASRRNAARKGRGGPRPPHPCEGAARELRHSRSPLTVSIGRTGSRLDRRT